MLSSVCLPVCLPFCLSICLPMFKIETFNEQILDVALSSGNKLGTVKNVLFLHYAADRHVIFSGGGLFQLRYSLIASVSKKFMLNLRIYTNVKFTNKNSKF
ncbi:hypothetical protein O3M35_009160 [Rhynocoris fuscipes]|uniref:Uncharacterized protein n=1 Tax=Rhynocoris fuscipes TaxID=488301 RepID=A0AAW1D9H5_9HEMI